eukprot:Opistho-1_new@69349
MRAEPRAAAAHVPLSRLVLGRAGAEVVAPPPRDEGEIVGRRNVRERERKPAARREHHARPGIQRIHHAVLRLASDRSEGVEHRGTPAVRVPHEEGVVFERRRHLTRGRVGHERGFQRDGFVGAHAHAVVQLDDHVGDARRGQRERHCTRRVRPVQLPYRPVYDLDHRGHVEVAPLLAPLGLRVELPQRMRRAEEYVGVDEERVLLVTKGAHGAVDARAGGRGEVRKVDDVEVRRYPRGNDLRRERIHPRATLVAGAADHGDDDHLARDQRNEGGKGQPHNVDRLFERHDRRHVAHEHVVRHTQRVSGGRAREVELRGGGAVPMYSALI